MDYGRVCARISAKYPHINANPETPPEWMWGACNSHSDASVTHC